MEAVLEQPLFSNDHKLVLPEGTHVEGSVATTNHAGWFYNAAQLRFTFHDMESPTEVVALRFRKARQHWANKRQSRNVC